MFMLYQAEHSKKFQIYEPLIKSMRAMRGENNIAQTFIQLKQINTRQNAANITEVLIKLGKYA